MLRGLGMLEILECLDLEMLRGLGMLGILECRGFRNAGTWEWLVFGIFPVVRYEFSGFALAQ